MLFQLEEQRGAMLVGTGNGEVDALAECMAKRRGDAETLVDRIGPHAGAVDDHGRVDGDGLPAAGIFHIEVPSAIGAGMGAAGCGISP